MIRKAPRFVIATVMLVLGSGCVVDVDDEDDFEVAEQAADAGEDLAIVGIDVPEPACSVDDDCREGWCGADVDGNAMCRAYVGAGEICGGYMPPGMAPRCEAGLSCVFDPEAALDMPGRCELEPTVW